MSNDFKDIKNRCHLNNLPFSDTFIEGKKGKTQLVSEGLFGLTKSTIRILLTQQNTLGK